MSSNGPSSAVDDHNRDTSMNTKIISKSSCVFLKKEIAEENH